MSNQIDTFENIGRYFAYFYRKGRSYISKELEDLGVGPGQAGFMIKLYEEDGINQEKMAEILFIDKGTVARALQKLETNGLIQRITCETDKRSKIIFLTEKGRSLESKITKVLKEWDKILSENLSEEEIVTLKSLLKKMADHFE